jgi:ComF family protein
MLGNILNLLFPSKCPICSSASDKHDYNPLCSECWSSIERYTGPACSTCGLPTPSPVTGICGECLRKKPPFSKILCYGIYDGALKESIHLLKFQGVKRLAKPLSSLLLRLPLSDYDAIVPVPLHSKKLKEREFNQTALLGRHLSGVLKIPLLLDSLIKIRETKLQTEVGRTGRLRNLKKAFAVSGNLAGRRLLLVDDVITTGATVNECSFVLMKAGASEVEVIALARSMPKY